MTGASTPEAPEITLDVLGHVRVAWGERLLSLSLKAKALLAYLALEGGAQHREHLADLLWESANGLANLRVELAALRKQGLDLFPSRQALLSLHARLDLDAWLETGRTLGGADPSGWLAALRGLPLSGLEDLGTPAFQEWVAARRWAILEQVEVALGEVRAEQLARGHHARAELVRLRGERLGLHLPGTAFGTALPGSPSPPPGERPAPPPEEPGEEPGLCGDLSFRGAAEAEVLRRVAARAERGEPQLVVLTARRGAGKRTLISETFRDTPWQVVQVQGDGPRSLVVAAVAQQLLRLLPSELHPPLRAVLHGGSSENEELAQLADSATRSGRPLVFVLHDLSGAGPALASAVRLVLDLPAPLLLVLCTASEYDRGRVTRGLGTLDLGRVHHLTLAPPSLGATVQALRERWPGAERGDLHAWAGRLQQQSDGWLLHLRALLDNPPAEGRRAPLPAPVQQALLAEMGGWPPELAHALPAWSLIYGGFDEDLASRLAGLDAALLLREAVARGLLSPASPVEEVHLPALTYRASDLVTRVTFGSEPLRTVLAATLDASQRRRQRAILAEHYLSTQPALALDYAERAGLTDLAAQARARLPQAPPPGGLPPPAAAAAPPPTRPGPAREVRTGNSYRLLQEGGWLSVLRYGTYAPAPAPRLALRFALLGLGRWTLTARLDLLHDVVSPRVFPPAYPLAVRLGQGPRLLLSPHPLVPFEEDGVPHHPWAAVPLHTWFTVGGEGATTSLELSVRAMDVALTLGALTWNGRDLLSPETS